MARLSIRALPISPDQQKFRELKTWLRGYVGGRGAGKTRIGCTNIYREAKPGDSWMVVSPDNNMIRETTLPTFIDAGEFTHQYIKAPSQPNAAAVLPLEIPEARRQTRQAC